jgi:hypothetical protein
VARPGRTAETVPRRLAFVCLIAASLILALAVLRGGDLWRASYPHLPRRVQGAPYRLRSALSGPTAVPVRLPTAPGFEAEVSVSPVGIPASATLAPPEASPVETDPPPASTVVELSSPTGVPEPLPASASVGVVPHEYQTWNNCGPATVSMALGFWGVEGDQADAAAVLKPDPDDKNVSPYELATYVTKRGLQASIRVSGTREQLRALLAKGIPVIVETWFIPEPGDEMGHYRVLTGYDDESGAFFASDSYNGPDVMLPYDEFSYPSTRQSSLPRSRRSSVRAAMRPKGGRPQPLVHSKS